MTQTVVPRPIAWILTTNDNDSLNLAPFSYFNAVGSDPATLAFSIGLQPDGTEKDTLRNIRRDPHMVIHIASCSQLVDLNQSSATLPPGESEVSASNLSLVSEPHFPLPRLEEAKIAFFCRLDQIIEIGNNRQALVLAEVESIYVHDEATETLDNGRLKILADKVEPLARLGASEYVSFGEILSIKRPA
ncbi:MAG: flavin reductase family protein [Pseudomonadota bacterium]